MWSSWWRKLVTRQSKTLRRPSRPNQRKKSPSFQLHVEGLETRLVPTFLAPVNVPAGVSEGAVVIGDFNGDGKQDIAVSNINNTISVALNNGNGTFQAPIADFRRP